jgi:hypothetical protein
MCVKNYVDKLLTSCLRMFKFYHNNKYILLFKAGCNLVKIGKNFNIIINFSNEKMVSEGS